MTAQLLDKEHISVVVRNYVEGMVFADEVLLRQAFHPACRIIGHYHEELEWLSLDDFISAIKAEGPAAKEVKPFWETLASIYRAMPPPSKSLMTTRVCASRIICRY